MTSKMKSDVWNYFELSNADSPVAICKFCKKKISRGGKSHTTSNLNKHLKVFHTFDVKNMHTATNSQQGMPRPRSSSESSDMLMEADLSVPLQIDTNEYQPSVSPSTSSTAMSPPSCSPMSASSASSFTQLSPVGLPPFKTSQPTITLVIKKKSKYKKGLYTQLLIKRVIRKQKLLQKK